MTTDQQTEQLQFIEGVFSPADANEMLSGMFTSAMSFYTKRQWREWEANHSADLSEYKNKLAELDGLRAEIKQQIQQADFDEQLHVEIIVNITTIK